MYQTPTLKRSYSSKRIIPRTDDSDDEDNRNAADRRSGDTPRRPRSRISAPNTPSRRPSTRSRPASSHSSLAPPGARADVDAESDADAASVEAGSADEPVWMSGFDESRSARENKSLAVSAELDEMGMGRYQWYIFFLCGLGFFIDLLFAQMFGLITVPLRNETGFGAEDSNIGTLSTAFNVGLTVGAFTWGIGVDVLGRKWSFYLTCLIAGIFGISSGAPPTFTGLRVLTAFTGFGVGGNIPIDCTITLEFLPTQRHFLLALLSIFQPIGTLAASGIAYGFIPKYSCEGGESTLTGTAAATCTREANSGWRYSMYTIGAITLLVFFVRFFVFTFRESPAYLINRGHDQEALKVLYSIAKLNKAPKPRLTIQDFQMIEERCAQGPGSSASSDAGDDAASASPELGKPVTTTESARSAAAGSATPLASGSRNNNGAAAAAASAAPLRDAEKPQSEETTMETAARTLREVGAQLRGVKILFRSRKTARITILLWLTYMADFFGFNIAGVFLPLILNDRGVETGQTLSETYRDYVAIYAPGIAACLLACTLIEVPRVGRQWVMVISSALMAISLFLYTRVSSQAGSVGLNAMEYFFQSLFNAVLYAVVPEFYPSAVRGTAAGLTSTLGRIAGIIAPIAGQSLYGAAGAGASGATKTLYLGGGVTLLCPLALMLLPYDTRGRRSY